MALSQEMRNTLLGVFEEEDENKGFLATVGAAGKRTGSKILDVLMNLDRPRRAVWLGIEAATEGEDILEAAGKGWRLEEDLRTQDFFDPKWRKEHPVLAGIAGFTGDVLGDPLTYFGAGAARAVGKGIAAATPNVVRQLGAQLGESNLANALGIYGGRSKIAKELADKTRGKVTGAKFGIQDEVLNIRAEIQKIADDVGTNYTTVARALNESLESSLLKPPVKPTGVGESFPIFPPEATPGLTSREVLEKMGVKSDDAVALSDRLRLDYRKMLDAEDAAGIPISDLLERSEAIGVGGYLTHILTRQARKRNDSKSFKEYWRKTSDVGDPSRHPSMIAREMEPKGTIREINDKILAEMTERGYKNPYSYFYEDPALIWGIRSGRSTQALAGVNYLDEIGDVFGVAASKESAHVQGLVQIPGITGKFFDPTVAKLVTRQHRTLMDKGTNSQFLRHFDTVQGLWKMWSLGVRPAYHTRNFVGNVWNAYSIAGVKNPKVYREAAEIQNKAWRGTLSADDDLIKVKIDGETRMLSSQEIYDTAIERGVLGKGQYGADIVKTLERDLEFVGAGPIQRFIPELKERYKLLRDARKGTREMGATPSWYNKWGGSETAPLRWGFQFGNMVEGNARMAVYINSLKKGQSFDKAAWTVKKTLFDYSDLSHFERNVLKRIIPFYTWTRKNIPVQIEAMLKHPERYQKITTARENIEFGHGRPDPELTEWWGKRVPIYIGKNEESDIWKLVSLLNYAPVADLERLGRPADLISEMITPFLKEPIEQLSNYSFYRKKDIVKYKGQTQDFLGVRMPKRIVKLAENLVPIAEFNRLNPFGVFGEALLKDTGEIERTPSVFGAAREGSGGYDLERGSRLLRYITGLRAYPVDPSKGQYWKFRNQREDFQTLRRYLIQAQRAGRTAEANELIRLIDDFMRGAERRPIPRAA